MGDARPDTWIKVLAGWISYLLVFSWLPLLRAAFDGPTYQWGTTHFATQFRGAGVSPDIWVPALKCGVMALLLWLAYRRRDALFRALLVLWSGVLAVDAIQATIRAPESFEFHGDTLGIHVNLGPAVVTLFTLAFGVSLAWSWRNRGAEAIRVPWIARNRRLLLIWLLLLPIQFVLLRFGEPHGTTDAVGVLLTIAQCPLLAGALYPWR